MKNNNKKVVSQLSLRSLKNNKMRNIFAIAAIALTCMMFTALAAMGMGISDAIQESTMKEVGTRYHAGLKAATKEQMEKVTADARVKDHSWNILLGTADSLVKRQYEIRLAQNEKELENSFIHLKEGTMPQKEEDIVVDTFLMDELKIPYETGAEIPLEFTFHGQKISKTFRVCGWYEGITISHASELYISETFWKKLKGNLKEQDFIDWGKAHPEEESVGLYSVGLYFEDAKNTEKIVRSVISDAGYHPDGEDDGYKREESLDYGINWAYMQNRTENADPLTIMILGASFIVILFTGYLIIYNIFYISVFRDIRFYGLLKTVGTTKKQLQSLIRRQALILSVIGIPVGLVAGYAVSNIMFPFVMEITAFTDYGFRLKFRPEVAVFGIIFALFTVFISCRKPGKMAGSVSPVEAVRYTEGGKGRKRQKKSESGAKLHRMALSNMGRNKKKTALVLTSLSLSMMLLCVVLTGVQSFQVDDYLEQRLLGDVLIGSNSALGNFSGGVADLELDPDYVSAADARPGITSRNELWQIFGNTKVFVDEEAMSCYQNLLDQGKLNQDGFGKNTILETTDRGQLWTDAYAYDDEALSKLKVLDGKLDIEKFQKGGYILMTEIIGDHTEGARVYEPGEKVKFLSQTEDSKYVETKDQEGNITEIHWENLKETEYEVMAIVDVPISMTDQTSPVNGVRTVLPKKDVEKDPYAWCFAVSYEVEEDKLDSFIKAVNDYSENVNKNMGYLSKSSLMEGFQTMIGSVRMVGIALSAVIAFIGVLNFINSMITGMIARKREFAVLCSIGMTEQQLKRMILEEGMYYVLISGVVSLVLGTLVSWGIMTALNNVVLFFSYQPSFLAFLIMIPLLLILAAAVPYLAYNRIKKESIVERLRNTEE